MGLYFAYGSNLNVAQMAQRCPAAERLGRFALKNWRLVFRCVADCVPEEGAVCYGGIWRITPRCEEALDVFEGVRRGVYRKAYVPIGSLPSGETTMLTYRMNSTGVYPPSEEYLDRIAQGYADFGWGDAARTALNDAVRDAWDRRAPTEAEHERFRRNGHPQLARIRPDAIERTDGAGN